MSAYKYQSDIREKYLDKLGENLGPVYLSLLEETITLNAKWAEFKKLYGDSQERLDLLNRSASFFFRLIEDILFEDIVLHIAKLTDKEETLGKKNLTIKRLSALISDNELALEINGLIQICISNSDFTRDRRNRHSAHLDLQLAIENGAEPLEAITRKQIETSIQSINNLLNKIEGHYLESETYFQLITTGTAEDLVFELNYSKQHQDKRKNRILSGNYHPEDLEPMNKI